MVQLVTKHFKDYAEVCTQFLDKCKTYIGIYKL